MKMDVGYHIKYLVFEKRGIWRILSRNINLLINLCFGTEFKDVQSILLLKYLLDSIYSLEWIFLQDYSMEQ